MTLKEKLYGARYRVAIALPTVMALVLAVSATSLNTSVSDLLYAVADIMPHLVSLVVAAVPVIVVIALATFITSFLSGIVKKIS
jgi:hypothetical protein